MTAIPPELAASIAARYGATVPDTVTVQTVPVGRMATLPEYVWDGHQLVERDDTDAYSWRKTRQIEWNRRKARQQSAARQAENARIRAEKAARHKAEVEARARLREDARVQAAEARLASVKAFAAQGKTLADIAAFMRITESSAAKYCRRFGVAYIARSHVAPLQRARLDQYRALIAKGASVADIVAALNVQRKTVRHVLRKYGLVAAPDAAEPPRGVSDKRRAMIEARRKRVAELVAKGLTRAQICETLGCGTTALHHDLHALGLQAASGVTVKVDPRITSRDERRAEVARLRGEGLGLYEIARQLGMSSSTVHKDLLSMGLAGRQIAVVRDPDTVSRIKALALSGKKRCEIAGIIGVSEVTVQRCLKVGAA